MDVPTGPWEEYLQCKLRIYIYIYIYIYIAVEGILLTCPHVCNVFKVQVLGGIPVV